MTTQRVAADDVKAIYPTANTPLQPFIETATAIVSSRLVGHYSEAILTEIERYLSAHFAWTSAAGGGSGGVSGQVSSVRADEITVSYATTKLGSGLDGSPYGQHLRFLDAKGILAQSMQAIPVHFSVF